MNSGVSTQDSPSKVLLIEDNPGDVRLLREALLEPGARKFSLTVAERLEEGLTRLSEKDFDVVLLDLSLPDAEGLDTVTRAHEAAPQVPIVVLTGTDDEELAIQAVQSGAQDYLVKGQIQSTLLVRALRYAIERNRLQAEVRSLSLKDELTGLYNRRGFSTFAERQLKVAYRTRVGVLLIYADLDGLKQINDTLGHRHGDQALIRTAQILRHNFRDSDIIARLGGDEFTILAADDDGESARIIMTRLQEDLKRYNEQEKLPYTLSLSVGSAPFDPLHPISLEELMARADQALYEHKRSKQRLAQHQGS
jgi:two-component system cell cycle response regulator